jgi:type VI secretion system protein VasG
VGHGKGGVLTEAVRHKPYSLVLLDEVEKAHTDVMELFYQVFDKGMLEDSEGLSVNFKNTLILLTSNVASEAIIKACRGPHQIPAPEELVELVRPVLLKYFKPAFLGRLVIVPFFPLTDRAIQNIVRLKLNKIQARFHANHNIALSYSNEFVAAVAARCTEVDTGARNVDHILTQVLLPELSGELLNRMAIGEACTSIYAYLDKSGDLRYRFEPPLPLTDKSLTDTRSDVGLDWYRTGKDAGTFPSDGVFDYKFGPNGRSAIRLNRRKAGKRSRRWLDMLKRL